MSDERKEKWTPKPWRDWTSRDGSKWVVHGDGSRTICRVTPKDGRGYEGQSGRDDEGCANAALLAAAPEMFELGERFAAWSARAVERWEAGDLAEAIRNLDYARVEWIKLAEKVRP